MARITYSVVVTALLGIVMSYDAAAICWIESVSKESDAVAVRFISNGYVSVSTPKNHDLGGTCGAQLGFSNGKARCGDITLDRLVASNDQTFELRSDYHGGCTMRALTTPEQTGIEISGWMCMPQRGCENFTRFMPAR